MIISDCSNPRSRLANRSDRTYLCVTSRYGGKPCQFMNITANTAATNLISSLWATIATWTVPFARGVSKNWCQHFPLAMTITSAATCRRGLGPRCAPIVRTRFKNVFWPNIFVGASFQILDIQKYASGLRPTRRIRSDGESSNAGKLGPAAILNQNPIFEMASWSLFSPVKTFRMETNYRYKRLTWLKSAP
jgi:hypothetical protein